MNLPKLSYVAVVNPCKKEALKEPKKLYTDLGAFCERNRLLITVKLHPKTISDVWCAKFYDEKSPDGEVCSDAVLFDWPTGYGSDQESAICDLVKRVSSSKIYKKCPVKMRRIAIDVPDLKFIPAERLSDRVFYQVGKFFEKYAW